LHDEEKRRIKKKKKDRIEQPYGHLLCIAYGSIIKLTFTQRKIKIGSIRPRSVNDQITTLPFVGVQKYYDGSVAFYIYYIIWFVCDSAIPKLLFVK